MFCMLYVYRHYSCILALFKAVELGMCLVRGADRFWNTLITCFLSICALHAVDLSAHTAAFSLYTKQMFPVGRNLYGSYIFNRTEY